MERRSAGRARSSGCHRRGVWRAKRLSPSWPVATSPATAPATAADFAWWSGLKLSDARAGVHLAGNRLDEVTWDGQTHWFVQARPSSRRSQTYLLPAFDEFVVGYTDRSAVLEPAFKTQVNAGGGILHPTIVMDGKVVGTWKRRLERGRVAFMAAPFRPLSKRDADGVARTFRRYAEFLAVTPR